MPTALRVLKDVVLAVAHQATFSTPAATTSVQKWQVFSSEVDPGYEYIHPRGTTGSHQPKDTQLKVAERPKATLEILASPKILPFLWEYALGGQPQATFANGDLTEAGEAAGVLSAWLFNGVRPGFNTAADFKLYVTLTDETPGAGQARVQVYKDAARTLLVAQGDAADGNVATLAEQNSSGLSGTVQLGAVTATNSGITLTIVQVRPQHSGVLSRYLTLWRDHGPATGLERISGCVVEKLTRLSEESGVVVYKLELVGADYNFDAAAGGTFTGALATADKEYQVHGTVTVNTDVDGVNVPQHALKIELGVENDIEVVLANASTASAIVKRAAKAYPITWTQKLADESQVVLARGLTDTIERVKVVDAYAARTATFDFKRVKSVEPSFPKTDEDGWDEVEHKMQAFEETASSPTPPVQVTLML